MIDRYELGHDCRMAQAADLTFDASVFEILAAWTAGATLVAAAGRSWRAPVRFLAEHGITHLDTVPSVIGIARRMRTLTPGALPDLRWSMFSGEQLTYDAASAWRAAAPGSVVENNYGPTELAGVCVSYRLPDDPALWPETGNGTVPIGTVYPHLEAIVLGPGELRPPTVSCACGARSGSPGTSTPLTTRAGSCAARHPTPQSRDAPRPRTGTAPATGSAAGTACWCTGAVSTGRSNSAATGSSWTRWKRRYAAGPASARPQWSSWTPSSSRRTRRTA
ncbi:AMP-binding protein [Streptomyces sp. AD16]|nr:AMP-binding protein [Streptomyces sp. AD16]